MTRVSFRCLPVRADPGSLPEGFGGIHEPRPDEKPHTLWCLDTEPAPPAGNHVDREVGEPFATELDRKLAEAFWAGLGPAPWGSDWRYRS